jgi:hypothetical protein
MIPPGHHPGYPLSDTILIIKYPIFFTEIMVVPLLGYLARIYILIHCKPVRAFIWISEKENHFMKKYLCLLILSGLCSFSTFIPHVAFAQEGDNNVSNPFSQSKFVPDIALIVDFSAVGRNLKNEKYTALQVPGFIESHGGDEHGEHSEHSGPNSKNGFNFNYAELSLYSVVDPYFDLFAVFHLHQDAFEIEEAYMTTRSLPLGLKIKAGKFRSSFGRLNEQHAHYWDFANTALVYKAFFGLENLNEIGMQLTWLAPTSFYLKFGAEILTGDNEASFGSEGFEDASATHKIEDSNAPDLFVGNIRSSLDADELVALFGVSLAHGKTRMNAGVDEDPAEHAEGSGTYGNTSIFGGDLTLKYLIASYSYLSFQSEYLYRNMSGDLYDNNGGMMSQEKKQSGLYSQLVYRMSLRWRAGLRYDLLQKNLITIGGEQLDLPENLSRYTAMLEYNPTEFSRLRLQYSHDSSGYLDGGASPQVNNEVIFQLNITIGAHGAHTF